MHVILATSSSDNAGLTPAHSLAHCIMMIIAAMHDTKHRENVCMPTFAPNFSFLRAGCMSKVLPRAFKRRRACFHFADLASQVSQIALSSQLAGRDAVTLSYLSCPHIRFFREQSHRPGLQVLGSGLRSGGPTRIHIRPITFLFNFRRTSPYPTFPADAQQTAQFWRRPSLLCHHVHHASHVHAR